MTVSQMLKSNIWISMLNICADRKFFIHESISCLRWRVTMMDRSFNGPCHEIKPTDSLFFHRGFVFNSNIWQRCLSGDRTDPWKTKTRNDVFWHKMMAVMMMTLTMMMVVKIMMMVMKRNNLEKQNLEIMSFDMTTITTVMVVMMMMIRSKGLKKNQNDVFWHKYYETSKWGNLQKTRNDNIWHGMQQRRLSLLENLSANNEWPCTKMTQMKFTIIEMRSWPEIWTRQKRW